MCLRRPGRRDEVYGVHLEEGAGGDGELIVRRVKSLNEQAAIGQDELS